MRLCHALVSNHARVPDLDLAVGDHLVLVGPNESGKSSILQSLSLLLSGTPAQLYGYFTADLVRAVAVPLVVEVTLTGVVDDDGRLFPHEITVGEDGLSRTLRLRLEVSVDAADSNTVVLNRTFPESGHGRGPNYEQLRGLGWRYLPAQRGSVVFGADAALRQLVDGLELDQATLDTFRQPLRSFNAALEQSTDLTSLRSNIAAQVSSAMPRTLDADGVHVRGSADPEADPLAGVALYLDGERGATSVAEQSDGVRQLLTMSLHDLAHHGASMVAVDEPEVHLHPSSQRAAARMFLASENQKIIATHSPYIVHAFQPQHVVAVTPERCTAMMIKKRFSEAEKIKAHWWSPLVLEALTARHVVFVEGVADRIIVEKVAELKEIDLARLGILVFDLQGADNFPHVYGLLGPNGFNLSWSGLVDKDHEAQWCGAVGGPPKTILNRLIWVCDVDLEDEYCRALGSAVTLDALVEARISRRSGLLQAGGVTEPADIPIETLVKRCRNDKVACAAAVRDALTKPLAAAITSVNGLLSSLASR